MYQRNLSTAIDGYLSELTQEDKIKVIQLARAEFDYISPEEITEAGGVRRNRRNFRSNELVDFFSMLGMC